jgi:NADPH:quinone reductase
MAQAIRIHGTGGPEVMHWEEVELGSPKPGEVLVRQTAVGVNYIDVYHRTGAYPLSLPSGIGVEGAGVIEAVGESVSDLAPGDRVAYTGGPPGAYADARLVPAARVLKLPDKVSDQLAASLIFKGLTVEYLMRRCYPVKTGDTVLWHAAAGGVGLIACQWLRHLGATVIGTVSSEQKAEQARANGCDYPIIYTREDFVQRVRTITNGEGVSVVYDSIGKDTFSRSLQCLRPRGMLVSFGAISGPTPLVDLGELGSKGSLFVTRPSVAHYTSKRQELEASAQALFESIMSGRIVAEKIRTYPLRDVAKAHSDLETGKTTGSLILVPSTK